MSSGEYAEFNQSGSPERVFPLNDDNNAARIEDAWCAVKSTLEGELNPNVFAAYIGSLTLNMVNIGEQFCELFAPSRFVCNHVSANFSSRINELFRRSLDCQEFVVMFNVAVIQADEAALVRRPATAFIVKRAKFPEPTSVPSPTSGSGRESHINPRYTFGEFVVGNSNQFCNAAALRVAENPGQSYNPLFIYGGVGLGKTHLLHAIGNAVIARDPSAKVLYMSSETFTNELILSLRSGKMDEFKRVLRGIHVLLIDDIQFICGKERTQEEFFHTFNALYSAKRQIVITSDKIPTEIPGIEERLQTRFSWGLMADLQAPDFETRVAILKQKALNEKFLLPQEVAHLIAEKVSSNVRELEGALTRLHAVSSFQNVPITPELARVALKHLLQPKVVSLTVDDIKKGVANHFGLKVSEMVSKRRTKNLSFPRHIAMYLCRKHTTASYPEIGGHFGGRDHSSVIHAATVVAAKMTADPGIKSIVEVIETRLLG